jgi:hypothetical protein
VEPERDPSSQASGAGENGPPPVHVLKLATFCTSQAEFISQFKAFLDDKTLFLPSKVPLSVGQTLEFSICLQDEKPMLEGRGEVIHVRPNMGGRAERSGLRVRVHELTPPSRFIQDAIMAARSVAAGAKALAARAASPRPATANTDAMAFAESPPPSRGPLAGTPAVLGSTPIARLAVSTRIRPQPGGGDIPVTAREEPANENAAAVMTSAAHSPVAPPGRLFAQGVQVSVPAGPAAHDDPSHQSDGTPTSPLLEVSTRSIVSTINSHLTDQRDLRPGTAVTQVESNPGDALDDDELLFRRRATPPGGLVRTLSAIVLSSLGTLAICWFIWGPGAERLPSVVPPAPAPAVSAPMAAAPPAAASEAIAVAPAAPEPVAPAPPASEPLERHAEAALPAAPIEEATAAAAPATVPTSGRCTARISTTPPGATASLAGRKLGVTPLSADHLPCEKFEVTLTRPRYAPVTVTLSPRRGTATALVRLTRPSAHLVLSSTPAHAVFRVNRAPASGEVSVPRYERSRIEATLAGHRPWKKIVYVTAPTTEIKAVLPAVRRSR